MGMTVRMRLSRVCHPHNSARGYDHGRISADLYTVVSRAFQILSDSDKKSQYDKFGHDPDNRFASASAAAGASPFSGFARSPGAGRGPMFEEEISPEELFRQFFGGGAFGGGPMGGFGGTYSSYSLTVQILTCICRTKLRIQHGPRDPRPTIRRWETASAWPTPEGRSAIARQHINLVTTATTSFRPPRSECTFLGVEYTLRPGRPLR